MWGERAPHCYPFNLILKLIFIPIFPQYQIYEFHKKKCVCVCVGGLWLVHFSKVFCTTILTSSWGIFVWSEVTSIVTDRVSPEISFPFILLMKSLVSFIYVLFTSTVPDVETNLNIWTAVPRWKSKLRWSGSQQVACSLYVS